MSPEELQAILRDPNSSDEQIREALTLMQGFAREALERGVPRDRINSQLADVTSSLRDGPVRSVDQLDMRVRGRPTGGGLLRRALSGLTFGLDDVAGRALGGAEVQGRMREEESAARSEFPATSFATEMAGGLALPGVAGVAAGARTAGARLGPRLMAAMKAGMKAGALGGGLQGAGEAERLRNVPLNVGVGMALGGAAGGVAGLAGPIVRSAAAPFREMSEPLADQTGARLVDMFDDAGIPMGEIRTQLRGMRGLGPDPVLADLAPNLADEAAVAAGRAPSVRSGVGRPTEQRVLSTPEDLARNVDDLAGFGGRPASAAQGEARAAQRASQGRAFRELEELHSTLPNEPFEEILADPRVRRVWRGVPKNRGEQPGFREFQDLLQRMRTASRDGSVPGRLVDDMRAALEDEVPGFRAANLDYARTSAGIRAFDDGATAVRKGWSPEEVSRALRRAEDVDAQAARNFKHGMADEIVTQLRKPSTSPNAALNISRRAIREVFPDEASFLQWQRIAETAQAFARTGRRVRSAGLPFQGARTAQGAPTRARIIDSVLGRENVQGELARNLGELILDPNRIDDAIALMQREGIGPSKIQRILQGVGTAIPATAGARASAAGNR